MYDSDIFDEAVFGTLQRRAAPRSARASLPGYQDAPGADVPEAQRTDFDCLVNQGLLTLTALLNADKATRVQGFERGYRIELGSALATRIAFDRRSFKSLIEADNPDVDLTFSDDLVNFEPEPDLVKKSKVPLWVLSPLGSKTILLKRIW